MKGFYHVQMAKECLQLGDIEGVKDHHLKGGDFYIEAADRLPEDDEEHACTSSDLRRGFPVIHNSLSQGSSIAVSTIFSNAAVNHSEISYRS
jgi:hypothetical protein